MLLNIFATDSKIVLWLTNLFIQQDESFFVLTRIALFRNFFNKLLFGFDCNDFEQFVRRSDLFS